MAFRNKRRALVICFPCVLIRTCQAMQVVIIGVEVPGGFRLARSISARSIFGAMTPTTLEVT